MELILFSVLFYILLFIIIFIVFFLINFNNSIKIMKLYTEELDPEKYLEAIDSEIVKLSNINFTNKQMQKSNNNNIEMLIVNKSCGLIGQGKFDEAADLLNKTDLNKLDLSFKILLEINSIALLYSAEKNDEATKLFLEKQTQINEWIKIKKFRYSLMGIIATYNFHIGNFEESKKILNELIKNKIPKVVYVEAEYLLALIDIKEGKVIEGKKRLSVLLEPTKKLYLYTLIKRELE